MENQKAMYFIRRGYALNPKNKLQAEFKERIKGWDNYLIDSVNDFHQQVQKVADECHQVHSRCHPLDVRPPNSHSSEDGKRFAIWVGELMCFEVYPLMGRWTKKGGFQLVVQLIIGQER